MPNYDQSCTSCSWEGTVFCRPFENPPCPSCGKDTERNWKSSRVNSDEINGGGGAWFENGFETPQFFRTHSEHIRALAEKGLEIKAKWAGPNDKHLTRWDAVDAYTLAAAASLVGRRSER